MNPILDAPSFTLVVGYGNTLRSDDGVGPCVAEAVRAWRQPGVRGLAVPQLTPELAEALAGARLALFVDACSTLESEEVRVVSLEPADSIVTLGHASGDPPYLLGLARILYGWSPPSWWILVPAARFTLGEGLSAVATRGVETALQMIALLIDKHAE